MKLNKRHVLAAALSVALGVPVGAQALTFTGGTDTVSGVSIFDWGVFSVLADGGLAAVAASFNQGTSCTTDCVFDLYAHGSLSSFQDSNNNPITSKLGTDYEVTFVIGVSEKVIYTSQNPVTGTMSATFGFGPDGKFASGSFDLSDAVMKDGTTKNFFRIYVDTAMNADPLQGTGFDDGTLILSGQVLPEGQLTSLYTASTSVVDLGGQGGSTPSAWSGVQTLEGSGTSSTLNLFVGDTNYTSGAFGGEEITKFLMSNISQALPFTTTNPSLTFPEGSITDVKADVSGNPNHINGQITFPGGVASANNKSILFQSDSNSPVASVPAPATIALLGLGLIGVGGFGRRSRRV